MSHEAKRKSRGSWLVAFPWRFCVRPETERVYSTIRCSFKSTAKPPRTPGVLCSTFSIGYNTELMRLSELEPNRLASLRLFLLGFTTLFLELALIRFLAGNIYNLGFFPNLVLLAVFIGMGIGFVFHHHLPELLSRRLFGAAGYVLFLLVVFLYFEHPTVPGFGESVGNVGGEVFFTSTRSMPGGDLPIFILLFLALVLLFSLISQRTAKYFRLFAPLRSYTLDICGSCAGIAAFMLISWLQLPAYVWFIALIPVFLALQEDDTNAFRLAFCVPLPLIAVMVWQQDARLLADPDYNGFLKVGWSPYQKVELAQEHGYTTIYVNGIRHQSIYPPERLKDSLYQLPYRFQKDVKLLAFKRVLIIGAGSGNDVAAALANGAEHVDAVEIDPVIADFGRRFNQSHPYQDPRVHIIVDDGRAVLTYSKQKYDLIVFALTDSLVKVSPMTQLRLENYLFTQESVRAAFNLLTDNGFLLFYNFYRAPFIPQKIELMVYRVTGGFPLPIYRSRDFSMLMIGRRYRARQAPVIEKGIEAPSDDWPFLYLRQRGIPSLYAKAMIGLACAIALLALFLRYSSREKEQERENSMRVKLAFLFMGVAFLLLETKSVIQFSLLFGTTWINNSLVFLAVLLFVLLANWTVRLFRSDRVLRTSYWLLIGMCVLGLIVPLGNLLMVRSLFLRFLLAGILTFSPIFFANLIFSYTFRNRKLAEHLFGWNLIGSALGGILEYCSMALGYNALAVVVAACYTAVFLLLINSRATSPTGA